MDEAKVSRVFRSAMKHAGLPHFRVYDLRHTFASLLLSRGAPITYVAAQLGHANPTTTLRHYARWIPTAGQRWVDTLDVGESGSRMVAKPLVAGRPDLEVLGLAGAGGGT